MSFPITLYITNSGDDYFDKVLTGGVTVNCDFKDPVDKENPVIFITGGASYVGYNYAYIPEFGRYYWMKPVTGNANTITFQGESDPLMSFKDQIRACPAVVARNPWHFDLYLPDNKLPIETRTASAIIKFNSSAFDGTNNCYVLTTLGSGASLSPTP